MQRLEMLARYKAWADGRLYATLAGVSQAELAAASPIFAGSILRTLNHVYLMDAVWKSHLLGIPHDLKTRNPETAPPFSELRDAQRDIDAWYTDCAAMMTLEALDEIVHFRFIGGGEGAMRREEIVLHVVNHGTYHRGHITAMLNQIGYRPRATDLPVYLREAFPLATQTPDTASGFREQLGLRLVAIAIDETAHTHADEAIARA